MVCQVYFTLKYWVWNFAHFPKLFPGPANVGQELKKPGIFTLSKMRF